MYIWRAFTAAFSGEDGYGVRVTTLWGPKGQVKRLVSFGFGGCDGCYPTG